MENGWFAGFCAASLIAGCAAPSQPLLDQMVIRCANGSSIACNNAPMMQVEVAREKQEQNNAIVDGLLVGVAAVAAGAAAGYAAPAPHYHPPAEVIVVCPRSSFGC
jgi:hypothetical protein